MIDFATLTGACVNALTERYSGAFTNRPELHDDLQRAGRTSGERVWPLSDGRGLRQRPREPDRRRPAMHARQQGRSHPRGALPQPLRPGRRCPGSTSTWRPSDRKGGLGHVPTDFTGFGVRYTRRGCWTDPAFLAAPGTPAMTRLTLRRPDDWHLHLRDGAQLAAVLPFTARQLRARDRHAEPEAAGDDTAAARGVSRAHPRGAARGRCASSR